MSVKWKHHILFRDSFVPWYDKTPLCWFIVALMSVVFLFAIAGIPPALEKARDCLWVPLTLATCSLILIIKIITRLRKRTESLSRKTK